MSRYSYSMRNPPLVRVTGFGRPADLPWSTPTSVKTATTPSTPAMIHSPAFEGGTVAASWSSE